MSFTVAAAAVVHVFLSLSAVFYLAQCEMMGVLIRLKVGGRPCHSSAFKGIHFVVVRISQCMSNHHDGQFK